MKKFNNKATLFCLTTGLIFFILSSCAPIQKLKFVSDGEPGAIKNDYFNDRSEKTIQPYDYLYVKIFSLDEKTNSIFNDASNNMDNELLSYSVDDKGNISLPFIGDIYVKDLTLILARDKIETALSNRLNYISVIVRFVSNKITVLGEVTNPGQHAFYDEKVSVFQAMGFAGGSSGFGDLSNVTLVREKDNVIKYYYLDLTKKSIAASEYYYLLPNDILIINPIKARYRNLRDYGLLLTSSVLTSMSAALSIILVTKELSK
jgi:polysaccharide export outer membrane protein